VGGWEKVGTVAAVVAALSAVGALVVSWIYGRRASRQSTKAVTYERLREARELVSTIRRAGDNTRFPECNDACASLRAIVAVIGEDLPQTRRLTEVEWEVDLYPEFSVRAIAARDEVDRVVQSLEKRA
jgi:hypothetical protein